MKLAIVLDCSDAARLVEFWSTALGYRHAGAQAGVMVRGLRSLLRGSMPCLRNYYWACLLSGSGHLFK